jgi:hypothetical protein
VSTWGVRAINVKQCPASWEGASFNQRDQPAGYPYPFYPCHPWFSSLFRQTCVSIRPACIATAWAKHCGHGVNSWLAPKSGAESPHSKALRAKSVASVNGAEGISDIEGKAATGSGERERKRASFKSVVPRFNVRELSETLSGLSGIHSSLLGKEPACYSASICY